MVIWVLFFSHTLLIGSSGAISICGLNADSDSDNTTTTTTTSVLHTAKVYRWFWSLRICGQ